MSGLLWYEEHALISGYLDDSNWRVMNKHSGVMPWFDSRENDNCAALEQVWAIDKKLAEYPKGGPTKKHHLTENRILR